MNIEDNVLYLKYIGELSESDLDDIRDSLLPGEFELKSLNASGKFTASLEDFSFITSITLSFPFLIELAKGIGTNAAWDAIKQAILLVRSKTLGKKYFKLTAHSQEEKEITFGLKCKMDKNTSFDFELKGDLSEKMAAESLDKILDFLTTQTSNDQFKHPAYLKYSKKKKQWVEIDVMKEIRKKRLSPEMLNKLKGLSKS